MIFERFYLRKCQAYQSSVELSLKMLSITNRQNLFSYYLYNGFFDFLCVTLWDEKLVTALIKNKDEMSYFFSPEKFYSKSLQADLNVRLQPAKQGPEHRFLSFDLIQA